MAHLEIELGETGQSTRVYIDGIDVSHHLSGITVRAGVGETPEATLELSRISEGIIKGVAALMFAPAPVDHGEPSGR